MSSFRRRLLMMAASATRSVTAWFYGVGFFHGEGWFYSNSKK